MAIPAAIEAHVAGILAALLQREKTGAVEGGVPGPLLFLQCAHLPKPIKQQPMQRALNWVQVRTAPDHLVL